MYRDTKAIFDELDIDIDPRARVGTLSVSQMQMIEIAKAFSYDAKIVIMDEPTSSLTEKEVNHLFTIIRKLKERGCGIVYISHKMEEIFQLCDEITVLRDGQWIATQPLEGLDMDKIIAMMVGRSLNQRFPDKENKPGEVILQVRNLTSLRQPSIRDISFDLHKGEILGIAGLVGAKRTDIVETLLVFVRNHRVRLRYMAKRLITTVQMKPSTMVLRWSRKSAAQPVFMRIWTLVLTR